MQTDGHRAVVSPPTVSWPNLQPPKTIGLDCPNCGLASEKPLHLTVNFATPDHPMRHLPLLRCDDCRCLFYQDQTPPDYAEGAMLGRGRVAFYLQQGAGLSLITRPLARVCKPPGSRYLEVGCGFGFGLDFATRANGWHGTGIDPGQIASVGAKLLGVPIEQRYLGGSEPQWDARCDVVMASETIEHVPSPAGFLRTLRRALRPGGVLILTTPNGDELEESTSAGLLIPLLSPGLHLVFQTRDSLGRLLGEAGLEHAMIETDGTSLVAYASDRAFTLENDPTVLHAAYCNYLELRAASVPPGSDLSFGFAGRLLAEAVNHGDMARAARSADSLREVCRARFGFDLATLSKLPDEATRASLERLADLMPLNLGAVLHADATRRLAGGAARATLAAPFGLAAEAAGAVRRALGELAMDDAMSEAVGWAAQAEALICAAEAGRPDAPARLRGLPAAPGDAATSSTRRRAAGEAALVCAVNAGHFAVGRELAAELRGSGNDDPDPAPTTPSARDVLFCLAVLDVQPGPGADAARSARRFAALLGPPTDALTHQAARGMFQALDLAWDAGLAELLLAELQRLAAQPGSAPEVRQLATRLARRLFVGWVNEASYQRARGVADLVASGLEDEGATLSAGTRDAAFCLGVLELQPGGDVVTARGLLARVRASLQPGPGVDAAPLFWAALRGEVQAVERLSGPEAGDAHLQEALGAAERHNAPVDLQARAGAIASTVP